MLSALVRRASVLFFQGAVIVGEHAERLLADAGRGVEAFAVPALLIDRVLAARRAEILEDPW
jgi:hypothetical protein